MAITPPTDATFLASLVAELGDTPTGLLDGQKEALAALYPEYTGYRRYLAVKGQALTLLIGDLMRKLDDPTITAERVAAVRLQLDVRKAQRESVAGELAGLLSGGAGVGVVTGTLSTTAPITSPTGYPNANDTAYGGDPNRRGPGGWR